MISSCQLKIIETLSKENSLIRQHQQERKCNNCKRGADPSEWVKVDSNRLIGPKNKPGTSRVGIDTRHTRHRGRLSDLQIWILPKLERLQQVSIDPPR